MEAKRHLANITSSALTDFRKLIEQAVPLSDSEFPLFYDEEQLSSAIKTAKAKVIKQFQENLKNDSEDVITIRVESLEAVLETVADSHCIQNQINLEATKSKNDALVDKIATDFEKEMEEIYAENQLLELDQISRRVRLLKRKCVSTWKAEKIPGSLKFRTEFQRRLEENMVKISSKFDEKHACALAKIQERADEQLLRNAEEYQDAIMESCKLLNKNELKLRHENLQLYILEDYKARGNPYPATHSLYEQQNNKLSEKLDETYNKALEACEEHARNKAETIVHACQAKYKSEMDTKLQELHLESQNVCLKLLEMHCPNNHLSKSRLEFQRFTNEMLQKFNGNLRIASQEQNDLIAFENLATETQKSFDGKDGTATKHESPLTQVVHPLKKTISRILKDAEADAVVTQEIVKTQNALENAKTEADRVLRERNILEKLQKEYMEKVDTILGQTSHEQQRIKLHSDIKLEMLKLLEIEFRNQFGSKENLRKNQKNLNAFMDEYWHQNKASKAENIKKPTKHDEGVATEQKTLLQVPVNVLIFHIQFSHIVMAVVGENGKATVLKNENNEEQTPACVAMTKNNRLVYGSAAMQALASKTDCCAFWSIESIFQLQVPSLFGSDIKAQAPSLSGKIFQDKASSCPGYIKTQQGQFRMTLEITIGFLLKKLKMEAERKTSIQNYSKAILAVPFWLSSSMCALLKHAVRLSGISQDFLVCDSVAAVYSFPIRSQAYGKMHENVLVMNEGFGQFNIYAYKSTPVGVERIAHESSNTIPQKVPIINRVQSFNQFRGFNVQGYEQNSMYPSHNPSSHDLARTAWKRMMRSEKLLTFRPDCIVIIGDTENEWNQILKESYSLSELKSCIVTDKQAVILGAGSLAGKLETYEHLFVDQQHSPYGSEDLHTKKLHTNVRSRFNMLRIYDSSHGSLSAYRTGRDTQQRTLMTKRDWQTSNDTALLDHFIKEEFTLI